jgi:muramidase (phage lysozyme)
MNRNSLKAALTNCNIVAFLHAIRLGEGTSDALGYNRIVGGGEFSSNSHHPNVKVYLPKYKVYSTAAGAYQIINPTWRRLVSQYGFEDFSPECQDEAAVALIAEKNALVDVMRGDIDSAIKKCSGVWASLPGSTAGQRIESSTLVKNEYVKFGGVLA